MRQACDQCRFDSPCSEAPECGGTTHEVPSDEEAWAAVERVKDLTSDLDRALHPSNMRTHAPDADGNALCAPLDVLARRSVVHSGPVSCQPCLDLASVDLAAAGWDALEQHAYENGWDDE